MMRYPSLLIEGLALDIITSDIVFSGSISPRCYRPPQPLWSIGYARANSTMPIGQYVIEMVNNRHKLCKPSDALIIAQRYLRELLPKARSRREQPPVLLLAMQVVRVLDQSYMLRISPTTDGRAYIDAAALKLGKPLMSIGGIRFVFRRE